MKNDPVFSRTAGNKISVLCLVFWRGSPTKFYETSYFPVFHYKVNISFGATWALLENRQACPPSLSLRSFSRTTINQNCMTAENDTASRNSLRINTFFTQPHFEQLLDGSSSRRPETDPISMWDLRYTKWH